MELKEKVTIEEMNRVIAEFMGLKEPPENFTPFCYNEFWDKLMSVVERIEAMPDQWGYAVRISKKSTAIFQLVPLKTLTICETRGIISKIESVHQAVYEFIIRYNKTQNQ